MSAAASLLLAAAAGPLAPPAEVPPPAAPAASLPMYVALSGSSTLSYLPPGGPLRGPLADFTPSVGFGVGLFGGLYAGVDVAPTWAGGALTSVSLTPGAFWCFHPNLYVAGRVGVTVHPQTAFSAMTGLGAMLPLGPTFTAFTELGAFSALGQPSPDLGLSLSVGTFLNF